MQVTALRRPSGSTGIRVGPAETAYISPTDPVVRTVAPGQHRGDPFLRPAPRCRSWAAGSGRLNAIAVRASYRALPGVRPTRIGFRDGTAERFLLTDAARLVLPRAVLLPRRLHLPGRAQAIRAGPAPSSGVSGLAAVGAKAAGPQLGRSVMAWLSKRKAADGSARYVAKYRADRRAKRSAETFRSRDEADRAGRAAEIPDRRGLLGGPQSRAGQVRRLPRAAEAGSSQRRPKRRARRPPPAPT